MAGLAGVMVAACGKVEVSVQCDEASCPEGQSCMDGECRPGGADPDGGRDAAGRLTFLDDDDAEFGAGSLDGVEATGDRVRLAGASPTGELRSRVFDAGSDVRWSSLRWMPAGPYGKPLADGQGSDRGYEAGAVDMSENVLLIHFDEAGPLASGATLADSSGRANDALLATGEPVATVAGVFGGAVDDTVESSMRVSGASEDVQFGDGDFTWSLWINARVPCQDSLQNDAYLGGEELGKPRAHVWMGCLRSTGAACLPGPPDGRPTATVCTDQPNDCLTLCGASDLPDGRWHHLAVRKAGHPEAAFSLWFDGVEEASDTVTLTDVLGFTDGSDLGIGQFGTPAQSPETDSRGILDEIAIFRRALSDDQLRDLYLRGVMRLRFQVRTCEEADCADDPAFVGPDGSDASSYEDADGAEAGSPVDLGSLQGRYFQYRAELTSVAGAPGPELVWVEIHADP